MPSLEKPFITVEITVSHQDDTNTVGICELKKGYAGTNLMAFYHDIEEDLHKHHSLRLIVDGVAGYCAKKNIKDWNITAFYTLDKKERIPAPKLLNFTPETL